MIVIHCDDINERIEDEWLVTNGIGGFACGTLSGIPMRKYHALLNAALPAPYGRTIMLNYVADHLVIDKKELILSPIQTRQKIEAPCYLSKFRIENGIPFWTFEINGIILEKSLLLIHRQNTLCMTYKVLASKHPIEMKWRPFFHFRTNEQEVNVKNPNESYTVHAKEIKYEIECPNFPLLKMYNDGMATLIVDPITIPDVYYKVESERGYASIGSLTSSGYFTFHLAEHQKISFIVSTESWETLDSLTAEEAYRVEKMRKKNLLKNAGIAGKHLNAAKLVLAADQFLMTPITRYQDMIRLQAAGEEVRSIIAGFPWFTDWGRDTMISLEGLTLTTGRFRDAYAILHTFAYYVKDGLIPNMFPDGKVEGIYNTADATLWFFHAINRYIEVTHDEGILEFLLPTLHQIIHSHLNGTKFGIKADQDGLLIQGQNGFQLTWMDAKVGDWVVTPRRGKAVEINALWFNALKLYELWSGKTLEITERCYESFNQKFWYEEGSYLYDVIEGEEGYDSSLRPNQLFAISLRYPILVQEKWKTVLDKVQKDLLTPLGLRTLSPSNLNYKAYYMGDLLARDAAYHQGTVWPWLIGPFVDVWLKVYPDDFAGAYDFLKNLEKCLNLNCIGTIGEIFDGTLPHKERGCFAQAWSVAELLRCLVKTIDPNKL